VMHDYDYETHSDIQISYAYTVMYRHDYAMYEYTEIYEYDTNI